MSPIAKAAAVWMVLAAGAASAACVTETVVETEVVHGTAVDHGRALFSDPAASASTLNRFSCATCHHAEGAAPAGAILTGAPLAGATQRPTYWGGQENDLLRAINDCRYYFMLAQAPWTAGDEEARAMFAYLSSLPAGAGETAPVPFTVVQSAVDLPPGDPAVGEGVYRAACATCHGAVHTGAGRITETAPRLPDDTNAEHAAEYTEVEQRLIFVEKVRHGGFLSYGGVMPPFSTEVLTDDELAALLAYFELY